jgi:hypothetical protein
MALDVECCFAECHYPECCYAECHYPECRYAECHYVEYHYAVCRYADFLGAHYRVEVTGSDVNTLAYITAVIITAVKSFILYAPRAIFTHFQGN